jgi:hypothetical protein
MPPAKIENGLFAPATVRFDHKKPAQFRPFHFAEIVFALASRARRFL